MNRKREAEREIINYIKTKIPRKAQQISVLPKIMHLASDIVVGCERNKFPKFLQQGELAYHLL